MGKVIVQMGAMPGQHARAKGKFVQLEKFHETHSTTIKKEVLARVKVRYIESEFDATETYEIVDTTASDPYNNKISDKSPLGAAVLNKRPGEIVQYKVPQGVLSIEILEIEHM